MVTLPPYRDPHPRSPASLCRTASCTAVALPVSFQVLHCLSRAGTGATCYPLPPTYRLDVDPAGGELNFGKGGGQFTLLPASPHLTVYAVCACVELCAYSCVALRACACVALRACMRVPSPIFPILSHPLILGLYLSNSHLLLGV